MASLATSHSAKQKLAFEFLEHHPHVSFVRLLWLDYTSALRGRILLTHHFRHLIETDQHHGLCRLNLFLVDSMAPFPEDDGTLSTSQGCLVADLLSLRLCPGERQHALVFCYFFTGPDTTVSLTPPPFPPPLACPRSLAELALQDAQAASDLVFLVGFEIEFVCHRQRADEGLGALSPHTASGIRTLQAFMMPVLCEISEMLGQSGIPILHFHPETADSQYELTIGASAPVQAVDALVMTRETIWKVCRRHSIDVSFSPASPYQNGIHLNLSIKGLQNKENDNDPLTDHFLAGVLYHLDSLCSLGLPLPESYDRTHPGEWCIGRHKAWGTQNRRVPIRKKGDGHWEFRFLDASSNFYLFLAALVYSGLDGISEKRQLLLTDCRCKHDNHPEN